MATRKPAAKPAPEPETDAPVAEAPAVEVEAPKPEAKAEAVATVEPDRVAVPSLRADGTPDQKPGFQVIEGV